MHDDLERELFEACLRLPPDERSDFRRSKCDGDRALEMRVHALLAAHEQAEGDTSLLGAGPDPLTEEETKQIGPYWILERIGEGGMGVPLG